MELEFHQKDNQITFHPSTEIFNLRCTTLGDPTKCDVPVIIAYVDASNR